MLRATDDRHGRPDPTDPSVRHPNSRAGRQSKRGAEQDWITTHFPAADGVR